MKIQHSTSIDRPGLIGIEHVLFPPGTNIFEVVFQSKSVISRISKPDIILIMIIIRKIKKTRIIIRDFVESNCLTSEIRTKIIGITKYRALVLLEKRSEKLSNKNGLAIRYARGNTRKENNKNKSNFDLFLIVLYKIKNIIIIGIIYAIGPM